jgi:hypothetical protein
MNASASSQSSLARNSAAVAAAFEYVRKVGNLEVARAALDDIASIDLEQRSQPDVELSVSEALRTVDSEEGRLRVLQEITSGPYPRYHAMPGVSDVLLRTSADGKQTLGRFVGREFREIG